MPLRRAIGPIQKIGEQCNRPHGSRRGGRSALVRTSHEKRKRDHEKQAYSRRGISHRQQSEPATAAIPIVSRKHFLRGYCTHVGAILATLPLCFARPEAEKYRGRGWIRLN